MLMSCLNETKKKDCLNLSYSKGVKFWHHLSKFLHFRVHTLTTPRTTIPWNKQYKIYIFQMLPHVRWYVALNQY